MTRIQMKYRMIGAGEMARYLITGGAGFIGSNFLSLLLEGQYTKVVCIDKLSYAGLEINVQHLMDKPRFTFVHGDITCPQLLDEIWQEPFDYIINFAAESHVDRSIQNPQLFFENNFMGTLNLLNKCIQHPPKLFVQISTDEVYGSIPKPYKADEKWTLSPSNPYSASKGSADLAVLSYNKTYGLPAVIVRAVNNFGPRQHPEKLIPKIIIHALNNKKIPVYGDGQAVRTWIYVEDFCEAILAIMGRGKVGEVYNIGSENEVTNLVVVRKILSCLGKGHNLIEYVDDRPGHDLRYALDYTKAVNQLDWKEKHTFDLAIRKTVSWYLNYFDRYNHLKQLS